jgi:hypothetical protein
MHPTQQTTVIATDEEGKHVSTNRHAVTTSETNVASTRTRKLAIAAGICYLITHVTSVSAVLLYGPILNNAAYVTGSGPDTGVLLGTFFDVILAMAIVGTAVALFPVVKRYNEGVALGYVGLRTLEAGIITVGVLPLLAVVTLRQHLVGTIGADAGTLTTLASAFVELYKWTALVGPGLVCGVNTVLMAYIMYRSRLVPRFIPVLGLVGGPLVFAYSTARMFGVSEQIPTWAAIGVIPIFTWEVSLALYLITRGFKPTAIAAMSSKPGEKQTEGLLSAA